MRKLSIGDVATKSGLAISAIRYYEECGLLPPADRQANNRRCYSNETLDTLQFISACRKNGMGLSAIRELQTKLSGKTPDCENATAILQQVIREISTKIKELQDARKHLSKVASACNADNCGKADVSCSISSNMHASVNA